jgi:hypothetical protein
MGMHTRNEVPIWVALAIADGFHTQKENEASISIAVLLSPADMYSNVIGVTERLTPSSLSATIPCAPSPVNFRVAGAGLVPMPQTSQSIVQLPPQRQHVQASGIWGPEVKKYLACFYHVFSIGLLPFVN